LKSFRQYLDSIASIAKGEPYVIDHNIPLRYFFGNAARRAIMLVWGLLATQQRVFLSASATVRCSKKITWGRWMTVSDDCFLDALSENGIHFGRSNSLGRGVSIECSGSLKSIGKGCSLGQNVGIGSFSFFGAAGGIVVGDDTIFGNFVSIHSENHNFADPSIPIRSQGVTRIGVLIGSGCWIGAKVTILDGANIGNGTVVAAGAVVLAGTYPDHSVLAGVPARVIKQL